MVVVVANSIEELARLRWSGKIPNPKLGLRVISVCRDATPPGDRVEFSGCADRILPSKNQHNGNTTCCISSLLLHVSDTAFNSFQEVCQRNKILV